MSISFVVPTYNRRKIISKSIDSILKIKKSNYDVIIVDDNSSDNTKSYVKKKYNKYLKNKKLKYYFLNKNIGVTGAKNFGYKKSKNKFIVFLDSDDKFFGKFTEFSNFLKKYNSFPIIFFKCYANKPLKKNIIGKIFKEDKVLCLSEYITNFSYGEALTVINKKKCKNLLPYKQSLRGFEGLGCIELIQRFGDAILISKPFRIYDNISKDRLSSVVNFNYRVSYIYKGYKIVWKKYKSYIKFNSMPVLILRIIKFKVLSLIYG